MTGFMDVHTHLHDPRIINDVPDIILRAEHAGVDKIATCATMEDNFEATADLSKNYPCVVPCFGIHPWFLDSLSPDWVSHLEHWLLEIPSGIGETGLDFMDKDANRERQLQVFKTHLSLACDLKRPVNIHVRKAWDAVVKILKHYGPLQAGGVIHSYSGSADLVPILEKYNLHISFSGSVTRPNAKKAAKALGAVSMDRIVFETDSPDIVPWFIMKTASGTTPLNQPANVPGIIRTAAGILKKEFQPLADLAYENSRNLFASILP